MDSTTRYWNQKETDISISDINLQNKDLYPILQSLKEYGFKVQSKNDYNSEFILKFSRWEKWNGQYTCELKVTHHRITWIYESFTGAMTGIEGWGGIRFTGSIQNLKDFNVVVRCTGTLERIHEWKDLNQ